MRSPIPTRSRSAADPACQPAGPSVRRSLIAGVRPGTLALLSLCGFATAQSSTLKVEPNPVTESGTFNIYGRPGRTVMVVWGKKPQQWQRVSIGGSGRVTLDVPPVRKGSEFTVVDLGRRVSQVMVRVVGEKQQAER